MEILPFLLGISVFIFFAAIIFFFWNVNSGQYDDLESPAHHILFDDDDDLIPEESKQNKPTPMPNHNSDDVR
ncbi:MAG: cbb3-type cytochrome oxidase assembly protein CcoS [Oceanospirillaceae bacterium]|nr:cbb3-type cytochrome oxidase assembly protein CcoS [Oceanospirillaceae bacterium]